MSNGLMIKRKSVLNRILSRFKRQRTNLESNIELYNFLKNIYSEEKRIMGIIPIIVFGQEQLDKITGVDISREDYIKSLKGIDELHNLKELYCRLGIEFDYDSVCEALSIEQLQVKRLSIKSPKQLAGYDLSRLPADVILVGYDCTKKYEINNGVILEKKEDEDIKTIQITDPNMKQVSYEDCLIEPEREKEYEQIMKMWEKVRNGDVSFDEVKQLVFIVFGENSTESKQILNALINRGKIGEIKADKCQIKPWELEPKEKKRIQCETAERAQMYNLSLSQENTGENKEQARS